MKQRILHDLEAPLSSRRRTATGPYRWTPTPPMSGRGFYTECGTNDIVCARHGSGFTLRIEPADKHVGGRLGMTSGYTTQDGDEFAPIVFRLPRGRGFMAGWTMGQGMASTLEPEIYDDIRDAAIAAYDAAEMARNREDDYQDAYRFGQEQRSRLSAALELLKRAVHAIRASRDAHLRGAVDAATLLQAQGRCLLTEAQDLRADAWDKIRSAVHPLAAQEGFAAGL